MKIPKLIALFAVTMRIGTNANTLVVNTTEDDGSEHTLRWAIVESNADGSGNHILIIPTGNPHGEWVIRVNSLLPNITAPVVIEGRSRGNRGTPEVVIDGSNVVDVTTTNSCPA